MQQPTNLDFVSIQVLDMKKSEAFYSQSLGFKKGISPNPHAVVFETNTGSIFAIRTPMLGFESMDVRGAGIALWFRVSDADQLYNRLVDEGVPIIKPIEDGPFGRVFIIKDPDGYAITIHNDQ